MLFEQLKQFFEYLLLFWSSHYSEITWYKPREEIKRMLLSIETKQKTAIVNERKIQAIIHTHFLLPSSLSIDRATLVINAFLKLLFV